MVLWGDQGPNGAMSAPVRKKKLFAITRGFSGSSAPAVCARATGENSLRVASGGPELSQCPPQEDPEGLRWAGRCYCGTYVALMSRAFGSCGGSVLGARGKVESDPGAIRKWAEREKKRLLLGVTQSILRTWSVPFLQELVYARRNQYMVRQVIQCA